MVAGLSIESILAITYAFIVSHSSSLSSQKKSLLGSLCFVLGLATVEKIDRWYVMVCFVVSEWTAVLFFLPGPRFFFTLETVPPSILCRFGDGSSSSELNASSSLHGFEVVNIE